MRSSDLRRNTRIAGLIKRYHEWPTSREQTNAEHTWHVGRIYLQVFGTPRVEVLVYIQYHDVGELGVGDIPFPAKANNKDLKAVIDVLEQASLMCQGVVLPVITPEEKMRVKICDLLEMWEFGIEEVTRGNKFGNPIIADTWRQITGMLSAMPEEMAKVRAHTRRFDSWTT